MSNRIYTFLCVYAVAVTHTQTHTYIYRVWHFMCVAQSLDLSHRKSKINDEKSSTEIMNYIRINEAKINFFPASEINIQVVVLLLMCSLNSVFDASHSIGPDDDYDDAKPLHIFVQNDRSDRQGKKRSTNSTDIAVWKKNS